MTTSLPQIWLLTDMKPGHRNQLRGLGERFEALLGAHLHWVDVTQLKGSWWQRLNGHSFDPALPTPQLLIAAGSSTQIHLLAARRRFHCPAVLLMRPNFPYRWLDAAIVPAHDSPPAHGQIFVSQGAINAVRPAPALSEDKRGLLLIGGLSQHFGWDDAALIAQIETLSREQPDWQWTLTNSRRTPPALLPALTALQRPNIRIVAHEQTDPAWLPTQLQQSRRVWVTPDSVSMVYEALTAGVPTGLFDLPERGQRRPWVTSRVRRGLNALIDWKLLTPFTQRTRLSSDCPRPQLWEADRAARWLIARFFPDQSL